LSCISVGYKQAALWVAALSLPKSPGHRFYEAERLRFVTYFAITGGLLRGH
jgi:hypothetical protein